jgi:hypothetical protein
MFVEMLIRIVDDKNAIRSNPRRKSDLACSGTLSSCCPPGEKNLWRIQSAHHCQRCTAFDVLGYALSISGTSLLCTYIPFNTEPKIRSLIRTSCLRQWLPLARRSRMWLDCSDPVRRCAKGPPAMLFTDLFSRLCRYLGAGCLPPCASATTCNGLVPNCILTYDRSTRSQNVL